MLLYGSFFLCFDTIINVISIVKLRQTLALRYFDWYFKLSITIHCKVIWAVGLLFWEILLTYATNSLLKWNDFDKNIFIFNENGGFQWRLSDSKSPQVFQTLLSILADLNNTLVDSSSDFQLFQFAFQTFADCSTFGITANLMFHSFIVFW